VQRQPAEQVGGVGNDVGREPSESLNVIDEQGQIEQVGTGRRRDQKVDVRVDVILPTD